MRRHLWYGMVEALRGQTISCGFLPSPTHGIGWEGEDPTQICDTRGIGEVAEYPTPWYISNGRLSSDFL